VGSPQQARPYQRRGVVAGRTHKKILIQLFRKGEEMKGEKMSAALMLAHLISIAPEMGLTSKLKILIFLLKNHVNVEGFKAVSDHFG
jgi:hypothetical protein